MNAIPSLTTLAILATSCLAETPKVFAGLLEPNVPVRAEIGTIQPPQEIEKYQAKLQAAQNKDPKKFREYVAQLQPGSPLPYNEVLGLTKEEHAEYTALLQKAQFTPYAQTILLLRPGTNQSWNLIATDKASPISTLRYSQTTDTFSSPSGTLTRTPDIKADPNSALGPWTGYEWRFTEETELEKSKQDIAIGKLADGKYGVLIYMNQSITTSGTKLQDTNLLIRFPLAKSTPSKASSTPEAKPSETKTTSEKPAKSTKPTKK